MNIRLNISYICKYELTLKIRNVALVVSWNKKKIRWNNKINKKSNKAKLKYKKQAQNEKN